MRYLIRRLGFFVLTLWAAMTLNFFIPRMMPAIPEGGTAASGLSKGGAVVTANQLKTAAGRVRLRSEQEPRALQYVEYLEGDGDRALGRVDRQPASVSR